MSCEDVEWIFQFRDRVQLLELANKIMDITNTIPAIIHRPNLYLKQNVSETRFCLRLQVERAQLGPIDRTILYLWTPATK
jgi:hypothetical protein